MPVFLRWLLNLAPLNPIAIRLVENGSRRQRHFHIRWIYLGVLILVLLWTLVSLGAGSVSYGKLASNGAQSFTYIAYLQILLICVLAPVFMAGAIAQEANPQTWEVLLTTPLSSLQIVLGNLLGRLFFILGLLAASLPLFALTQYFGGVPGTAIFASYLVAGAAALLVGSIAISLAVSRLAGKRAVFTFYVAVVTYLAITAGIDAFMRSQGSGSGASGKGVTLMTGLNPFLALQALLNPTTYPRAIAGSVPGIRGWMLESPVTFWCMGSILLSLVLTVASTFTVRAGGLGTLTGDRVGIPWYRRVLGLGASGAEHRPPRPVSHNPISWRESSARNATLGRIVSRWAFVLTGLAWGIGVLVWYHNQPAPPPPPTPAPGAMGVMAVDPAHEAVRLVLLITVWAELAVISLVAINMASTAVSREREDGTLDLLLTTPLTPSSYLFGKLRGLIAYLLPMLMVPIGTIAFASIYVMMDGLGRAGGVFVHTPGQPPSVGAPVVLPEGAILLPLVAIPFTAWCVMIGLNWSLKSKGTLSSVVGTVGVVGVIAGIVGFCGYKAGESIGAGVGSALTAMTPATLLYSLLLPTDAMAETIKGGGIGGARVGLVVGCLIAAGVYTAVVLGIQAAMVRTFDTTVRKLAGAGR
ncbi:MAG: ABC transporter permease [Planctomycetota bacterium]